MNVLLHITSDAAFARALAGLAEMVEPGGHLLVADAAVRDANKATPYDPQVHARVRSLGSYSPPGLSLQASAPTTVIGADPIEGSRVWKASWRALRAMSRRGEVPGALAGRWVYAVDPVLMRAGWSPSGKFLLFAKP